MHTCLSLIKTGSGMQQHVLLPIDLINDHLKKYSPYTKQFVTAYMVSIAINSLSLPCFPDFRGKGGYTSLPPGGRPSSTVLYPGPPSSSPCPPTH